MSWSIAEVARMSGVTARTLRHYHAVGLLTPAGTAADGRRFYHHDHLLRLQQILLLRRLDLGLKDIAAVLDQQSPASTVQALRRHRDRLVEERRRLGRLVGTVEATIDSIEKGGKMAPEKIFDGFADNLYEAEARHRWGDDAVAGVHQRMQRWSQDDAEQARTGYAAVQQGLARLHRAGVSADDEQVQRLVDDHYQVTCLFWTPTRQTYRGLGQAYIDDERFRQTIGGGNAALLRYLHDAMTIYADTQLN